MIFLKYFPLFYEILIKIVTLKKIFWNLGHVLLYYEDFHLNIF